MDNELFADEPRVTLKARHPDDAPKADELLLLVQSIPGDNDSIRWRIGYRNAGDDLWYESGGFWTGEDFVIEEDDERVIGWRPLPPTTIEVTTRTTNHGGNDGGGKLS